MLIKHTDCGGFYITRENFVEDFKAHAKNPDALNDFAGLAVGGFKGLGIEAVVLRDVEFMRNSPLIYPETVISGWVFDDSTGKVCRFSRVTVV